MEQKLQTAIKTLRKSINKQQFYIQFSGTEYEVAQKPAKATEGHEACSTGQVLQDGKCGKSQQLYSAISPKTSNPKLTCS